MNTPLLRKELRHYRNAFLVWAAAIVGLSLATMAAMPTMLANSSAISGFITAFPPGMLKAFSFDASSFTDPLGFYSVYSTLYVALLGSAFSISVSAGIIAREEGQGSADFLLAKPIRRSEVALTKITAWLLLVAALNVVTFLSGAASLAAFAPLPWRFASYVTLSVYSLLLSVSLGAIGLLFSLLVKRARSLTGAAIGIVLGLYLWDAVAKMSESYDAWGWISPFKWMDVKAAADGYALAGWRVALFVALAVGCAAGAVLVYRRKDILS